MTYYKKLYEKTRPYIYDMRNQWQEVIQHIKTVRAEKVGSYLLFQNS